MPSPNDVYIAPAINCVDIFFCLCVLCLFFFWLKKIFVILISNYIAIKCLTNLYDVYVYHAENRQQRQQQEIINKNAIEIMSRHLAHSSNHLLIPYDAI